MQLRHLSYRGIRLCIPVSIKSTTCEFSHVLTHTTNSSLLLKCCDPKPVLHVRKQVIVAWSEIRAVRKVVKQLPVEMLQLRSSASSALSWRSTTLDISIPCLLFWMTLCSFFLNFAMHFWHYCGPLLQEFHFTIRNTFRSQKTVAISFLAKICLNIFTLFG
jgi:hypothetical protein